MTTSPPFTVELAGPFPPERVHEVWTTIERRTTPEIEALIAETWAARLAEAGARGGMLWSAPMARLVDWRLDDAELIVNLGPTTYRDFVGTNVANPWLADRYGPDHLSDGCGVSTLVRTADGRLVLQRRSQAVFEFPGRVAACGGALEPLSPDDPSTSLVAQARREIHEELGLSEEALGPPTLLGIGRTTDRHKPELVFLAQTTATWPDLRDHRHQEHTALVTIADTADAVASTLRDDWHDYAPPGLLALTLHEICRFATLLQTSWHPSPTPTTPPHKSSGPTKSPVGDAF